VVASATPTQIDEWYASYKRVKYGDPPTAKDPTTDQIMAMRQRVIVLGQNPYGDFSVLTPFGRTVQKALRHRSWIPQEDGTFRPVDVPGPESFKVWESCWRIFESIMYMLRDSSDNLVITPVVLDHYFDTFKELCTEHPEAWHLCQAAEDRCRAEHIPRLFRQARARSAQKTWDEIFQQAADDNSYWEREVRRPANQFLIRRRAVDGITLSPQEQAERELLRKMEAATGSGEGNAKKQRNGSPGPKVAPQPKKPSRKHRARGQEEQKGKGKGQGDGGHPRKNREGMYVTTGAGKQICFKFSRGGANSCPDPCPNGRAHVCETCALPHRNAQHGQ
jgi:hypothetical protein